MKNLPVGVQSFKDMIERDYLYVDKTKEIHQLFADGGKYYFLSRPRRFGKSLLVSTLKELFSGNKSLFEGLWIHDKIDWKPHPVIHLDFLGLTYETREELIDTLGYLIKENARRHRVELDEKTYDKQFRELVIKLSEQGRVAVLVDEYDKPIIDFIHREDTARENRDILRNFYSSLKGLDQYLEFVFLTGVSRFSRVSVFSGLNNLRDITLSGQYATLTGYTEEELLHCFDDRLERFSQKKNLEREQLVERIREWYNGYSWDGVNFVYNPHSILNFFQEEQFDNYWFSSATPSFLIRQIRDYRTPIEKLENYEADKSIFESYDVDKMNVVSLLFQTGYLTLKRIKEISLTNRLYYFSYPNVEVKESFLKHLLSEFSGTLNDQVGGVLLRLTERFNTGDLAGAIEIITSLFASIPYDIFVKDREGYYHSIIYLVLALLGINVQVEVETSKGRIDAVVETGDCIYVMEFKLGPASEAIRQIKEKKYYQKYMAAAKPVKLVGVGFDPAERNIGDYILEDSPGD